MWVILFVTVLAFWFYFKIVTPHKYWKKKNVPHIKPKWFFGNMSATVFRTKAMVELVDDIYNAYPEKRYVGLYQFLKPTLLIRDLELIKTIMVKEFETFPDHTTFSSDQDPLWSKNLFALSHKDGWQDLRSTLSPSFTSSKMRTMIVLIQQCAQQFTDYFHKQNGAVTVELHSTFTRLVTDIIGTVAFGVTCNSLEEQENKFYLMGKEATDYSGLKALKFFGYTVSPALMRLFKVNLFGKEVGNFFRSLVKETLQMREENNIIRPDMIHLLMEARKGYLSHENESNAMHNGFAIAQDSDFGKTHKKLNLTDDDITAQALIFFAAGFDTTSTMLTCACYELAINPEIQQMLYDEIIAVTPDGDGKIPYEALLSMKYLENIISETLRKWPPIIFTDRKLAKPFKIEPEGINLDAEILVWIPIHAIHMDPNYYPNPEKFDPERFNDANKRNIKPFSYIPFGSGPRNCIGSRFALLVGKLIIVEILRNFEIIAVKETKIPLLPSKSQLTPLPSEGVWVGLEPRKKIL